eukprot:689678-Rhodomonas_salina.3
MPAPQKKKKKNATPRIGDTEDVAVPVSFPFYREVLDGGGDCEGGGQHGVPREAFQRRPGLRPDRPDRPDRSWTPDVWGTGHD